MARRTRLSIILDVLEAIVSNGGEVLATRLATASNMPYDRLVRLLTDLESRGLVSVREHGRMRKVAITAKGLEALSRLRELRRLLRDLGIEL